MPNRRLFKEPVVRVSAENVRFPNICPVCGSSTSLTARLTTTPGRAGLGARMAPRDRTRLGINLPPLKVFMVPVCEKHGLSDDSEWRYKTVCVLSDGLLVAMMIFATFWAGGAVWLGRDFPLWYAALLGLFMLAILTSAYSLREKPLERNLRVIGFDNDVRYVWLAMKNEQYRDRFLSENEMHSELVNWVVTT